MDLSLELLDDALLDRVYPPSMARDDIVRQTLSLFMLMLLGGYVTYLSGAAFSYYFLFDHKLLQHPKFLKNQVALEIQYACKSIPFVTALVVPLFLAEARGYSKLYANLSDYSLGFTILSVVGFVLFTDMLTYWIHRALHHRSVYARIHKAHHQWLVATPFASLALHPLDAFIQGLPYHLYVFFFPLHRVIFLVLFSFVNYWGISVHDGLDVAKNSWLNGAGHHSVHHSDFVYNYGLFFTFWDWIGGSYKEPMDDANDEPVHKKQH
jgi:Delta7-sterol 5-desaturase